MKNEKLYRYTKKGKLGPIYFQIEDNKVALTPFAVSKDGIRFFCCDSYIGELVDTGIDIICVSENIYFLYNSIEKIGKYVNFKQANWNNIENKKKKDYFFKKLDLKGICYFYLAKSLDISILISKNCLYFFIFEKKIHFSF